MPMKQLTEKQLRELHRRIEDLTPGEQVRLAAGLIEATTEKRVMPLRVAHKILGYVVAEIGASLLYHDTHVAPPKKRGKS